MSENVRSSFKNNFLKNLIFRLDFNGMMDVDVEDFIKSLRDRIFDEGYINLKEVYENNTNFNVLSPNNVQIDNDTLKIYQFTSPNNKILKISKSNIIFDINMESNKTNFSNYLPLIKEMIDELKKRRYLHFDRIGLRKTNTCVLLNKQSLYSYFKQNVLCRFDCNSPITQIGDELYYKDHHVNYNRRFQEGVIFVDGQEVPGYQIVLDIDAYIQDNGTNQLHDKIVSSNSEDILKNLNDSIFQIYEHSLTDEFIEKLKDNEFNDKYILGVIKNV